MNKDGKAITYAWTEQEVSGYRLESIGKAGAVTTFTNKVIEVPEVPQDQPKPRTFGNPIYIFEEYETALGIPVLINHVGDCFD